MRISLAINEKIQGETFALVVINSTIFPAVFLKSRPFDEFYRYGSEEIDMAIAATSSGLKIERVAAGNIHLHSPSSRSGNELAAICRIFIFVSADIVNTNVVV